MSDLIVIAYDDEFKADEVLVRLSRLQKQYLVDLEDACVVVRSKKTGKVKLKQAHSLVASGAVSGGFWGMLIGWLFLHPLAGMAMGATAGAVSGALKDVGIEDDFIRSLGSTIQPGTSALFVLARAANPDKVLPELREFGGKVLQTSLSEKDDKKLQAALEAEAS
jgi:uncharacterized membrane protein